MPRAEQVRSKVRNRCVRLQVRNRCETNNALGERDTLVLELVKHRRWSARVAVLQLGRADEEAAAGPLQRLFAHKVELVADEVAVHVRPSAL